MAELEQDQASVAETHRAHRRDRRRLCRPSLRVSNRPAGSDRNGRQGACRSRTGVGRAGGGTANAGSADQEIGDAGSHHLS